MILVDIGNSGLRAVRVTESRPLSLDGVWRLSWPADLSVHNKAAPHQHAWPNQKWCHVNDESAFDWLVHKLDCRTNETWLISSVKEKAYDQLERACKRKLGHWHTVKVTRHEVPVVLQVDQPDRVGMDRVLAAWEAWHQQKWNAMPSSVIVIQAGTAVTVDLITADCVYRGGAIMPGLGLSLQLLAAGTEQLPWVENRKVEIEPVLPGRNTSQAIAAGVHASLAGGASFLVNRYRRAIDQRIPVIVTGGDANVILPSITPPVIEVEHLVLRGLWRLAELRLSSD